MGSHGADAWRYLSLAWRAPLRPAEPAPPPVIKGLPQITMQQLMDLEDNAPARMEPGYDERREISATGQQSRLRGSD